MRQIISTFTKKTFEFKLHHYTSFYHHHFFWKLNGKVFAMEIIFWHERYFIRFTHICNMLAYNACLHKILCKYIILLTTEIYSMLKPDDSPIEKARNKINYACIGITISLYNSNIRYNALTEINDRIILAMFRCLSVIRCSIYF